MDANGTRRLANFSFVILGVYAPIETWASLANLLSPYYLVDVVGMTLLAMGILFSRRQSFLVHTRSFLALSMMCAGWAWLGANGWRATADRFDALAQGSALRFGAAELCFVAGGTLVSIGGMVWSLVLASHASQR